MHIFQSASRKALFLACSFLPFFMYACGGDSGSSATEDDYTDEEDDEDNLGGEEFKDSTIIGSNYKSKAGIATIIKSEILDTKSGNTYKTIQFGPYTWMAENANYKVSRSSCYEEDYENCESKGRLYQSMNADQACPSGFKIPTEADFKYLVTFANNIADRDFGFNLQMSGYCETVNGDLQCSRMDKEAYLLTSGFNVFRANSKGKYDFSEANFSAYYALRCMKLSHFVENENQLPTCDSSTYKTLDDFFVASKGKNYYCNKKKWVKDDENYCSSSERGEKHYYKDTLFICRNNTWEYATMNDVSASCTKENQWEVRKLNGQSYICDDSNWRKPSAIETAIGLCNLDSLQKMGTYINKKESTDYICDSTGWRKTVLTDSIGTCTVKNQWALKINYEQKYVCDDSTWRKPTTIEDSIGLCTPDSLKKMKTLKTRSDSTQYFCDTTGWRKAVLLDSIGQCVKDRQWEQKKNYGKNYLCKDSSWRKATAREDSIGFCIPNKIGKIDSLKSYGSYESYYCDSTGWRSTVLTDFYGNCDSTKFYNEIEYKGTTYVCRTTKKWDTLFSTEKNFGICTPKIYGKIDTLKSSSTSYICDSTGWRTTTIYDYYGNCDSTKLYTTRTYNGTTYGCQTPTKWEKLTHPTSAFGFCTPKLKSTLKTDSTGRDYICDSLWRQATKSEVLGLCDDDREGFEKIHNSVKYACANDEWRTLTKLENALGLCYKAVLDKVAKSNDTTYICKESGWSKYSVVDAFGNCTSAIAGKIVEFGNISYGCKNSSWKVLDSIEVALGICTTSSTKVYEYKGKYYYCSGSTWSIAPVGHVLEKCTDALFGKIEVYQDKNYYCSASNTWQEYTDLEKELGFCTGKNQNEIHEYKGKKYGCTYKNINSETRFIWREENNLDKELGFCHGTGLTWKEYNGKDYACARGSSGEWYNSSFWSMYGRCSSSETQALGLTVGLNGQHYYCNTNLNSTSSTYNYGWYALQAIDSLKGPCYKDKLGDTLTFNDSAYYCGTNSNGYYRWVQATTLAQYLGRCSVANEGTSAIFNGKHLQCFDGNWRRDPADYGTMTDARDGTQYKTIKIGKQEWMAENLKYEVDGSWCGGNDNGCSTYGRLYSWDMTVGLPKNANPTLVEISNSESHQGICPNGWRLPTSADWETLHKLCDDSELRKTDDGYDASNTDICGFSSLPAGYMNVFYRNGIDYSETRTDYFLLDNHWPSTNLTTAYWTSEQKSDSTALIMNFKIETRTNLTYSVQKRVGLSVRCIKK